MMRRWAWTWEEREKERERGKKGKVQIHTTERSELKKERDCMVRYSGGAYLRQ
jgi:hypothetical protein